MIVKINGQQYKYFNDCSIQTTLASVASTFAFSGTFDINNPVHKKLFKPLQYYRVQFFDEDRANTPNGGLLSTGTVVSHKFASKAAPQNVMLSGYSISGILEDCQLPPSAYPLEFTNQSLGQIGTKICKLLGINLIVYDIVKKECAQIIPRTVIKPDETLKNFLSKVAFQKNVIISHDIYGNIIMFKPDVKAAAKLSLNQTNCDSMELEINGQELHSDITCIRQPDVGEVGDNPFQNNYDNLPSFESFGSSRKRKSFKIGTIDNTPDLLIGLFRPRVEVLTKGTFYNTLTASQNLMAAELQAIKVTFTLPYWPPVSIGDIVEIINPEIYINTLTRMVIESTNISENNEKKVFIGTLVLPETFTGEQPKNIFS